MHKWFKKGARMERLGKNLSAQYAGQLRQEDDILSEGAVSTLDPALFRERAFDSSAAERTGSSNYSYWLCTFKAFWQGKLIRLLLVALCTLLIFTFIQPLLPNQKSPATIHNNTGGFPLRNQAPNREFWFGTNSVGQDIWSRIWAGTRTSLLISLIVASSNCIIGITVGFLWGYVRKLDTALTEFYNIIDNIPRTIILILISYIMRPGMLTMIVSMCCVGWLSMARFIRNQIVMIRDRDYNLASRCLGSSSQRIMRKNLLPYLISVIMLQTSLAIPAVISDEVFLTYCGLGMPVATPSLGNLVDAGRQTMMSPNLRYQLIFPALVVSFITVCFYLVGNAFADAADPRNHV